MASRQITIDGNEAAARIAHQLSEVCAIYPITPSSEIAELLARRLPMAGGKFIQMEDEMGSMAAVLGAAAAGDRRARTGRRRGRGRRRGFGC